MKKMLTIISLLLLSSSVYAQSGMELQSRPFRNLGTMNAYADSARFIFPDTTLAKASYKILPFDMTDGQFLEIDGMTGESAYQRFLQKVKGTSWYKDEGRFPRRGVIVVSTDQAVDSLYILDTTVSPVDTFMVFVQGNLKLVRQFPQGIAFQDGVLYVGTDQSGMNTIDFISEESYSYGTDGWSVNAINIQQRNTDGAWLVYDASVAIVNSDVNAVSVIRDPEGATDSFGRRLPIVSVETAGGNSTSNAGITAFYDAVVATYTPDNSVLLSSGDHFSTVLWTAPRSYFVWEYAVQTRSADVASLGNDESWGSDQTKSEDLPFADTVTFGAVSALSGQSVVDGVSPVAFVGTSAGAFIAHAKRNDNANGITIDLSTTHNIARSDTLAWDLGSVNGVFNNALTNVGSVTFGDGKIGLGATTDGSSNYLIRPTDSAFNFGTSDFAVSFWFKSTSATNPSGTDDYVLTLQGNPDLIYFRFQTDGNAVFTITDDNDASQDYLGNNISVDTWDAQWHHYVGMRDGSNWKFFVDGVIKETEAVNAASASIDPDSLVVGAWITAGSATRHSAGTFDQVAVWKRALTQDEISFLYNRGVVAAGNLSDYLGANDVDYASADPNSNTFTFGNQDTTYHTTTSGLPLARIASAGGNITDAHVIASGDSTAIYQATSTKTKIYQPDLTVQQLAQDKGVEFARPIANIKRFVAPSNLHLYDAVVDSAGYGDYTSIRDAKNSGAKTIFVKKGTYQDTVQVGDPDMVIVGEGRNLVLWNNANTTAGVPLTVLATATRFTLKSVTLYTATGGGGGGQRPLITVTGADHGLYQDIRILSSDELGMSVASSENIFTNIWCFDTDDDGFYVSGDRNGFYNIFQDGAGGGQSFLIETTADRTILDGVISDEPITNSGTNSIVTILNNF